MFQRCVVAQGSQDQGLVVTVDKAVRLLRSYVQDDIDLALAKLGPGVHELTRKAAEAQIKKR